MVWKHEAITIDCLDRIIPYRFELVG